MADDKSGESTTENAARLVEDEMQIEEAVHLLENVAAEGEQYCQLQHENEQLRRENAALRSRYLQMQRSRVQEFDPGEMILNFSITIPIFGVDDGGSSSDVDQDEIFINSTTSAENIPIIPHDRYDGVSDEFVMEVDVVYNVMVDDQIQSAAAAAAADHTTADVDQILDMMRDVVDDTGDYQNF